MIKAYSTAQYKPGEDTPDDYKGISWVHMVCCKVVVQWPCITTTSRCSHLILLNGEQVYKTQTKQKEAPISEARTFMHSCSWLSLTELSINAPCWFELVTRSKMFYVMVLLWTVPFILQLVHKDLFNLYMSHEKSRRKVSFERPESLMWIKLKRWYW